MRILQINSVCGVGSTGRITTDLYKVLEEQGHECLIAYGRGTAPEGINSYKIGTNIDNYLHVARTRLLDQHGYGSKKATVELVKKIKEYNPDIIHLHNLHGYYLNLEVLFNYLAESNKPVVWTLHDCWAFTGHCSHFDYIGCEKWKKSCFNCEQKREYPFSFFDFSNRNYEKKKKLFTSIKNMTIITVSEWLASKVKQSFLASYPIKVVPNGIDLDIFHPSKSDFRKKYNIENKIIILSVASVWTKRKGLEYINRLAQKVSKDYQVVVVGLTDTQIKNVSSNIIAINKIENPKDLAKWYSVANIFINPSLEETMGLVTVEAMACGTPVIVSNSTALPEVINENCGIIIEKNELNNLEKYINNFMSYFRTDCINHAQNYDKRLAYQEYLNLYLLAKKRLR